MRVYSHSQYPEARHNSFVFYKCMYRKHRRLTTEKKHPEGKVAVKRVPHHNIIQVITSCQKILTYLLYYMFVLSLLQWLTMTKCYCKTQEGIQVVLSDLNMFYSSYNSNYLYNFLTVQYQWLTRHFQ